MDISPEVDVHECLYSLGALPLKHVESQLRGDRERAINWVQVMIQKGWATLMVRAPGRAKAIRPDEVTARLNMAKAWLGDDISSAACFLEVTEAGIAGFENETDFFEKLNREPKLSAHRQSLKRGRRRRTKRK